MPFIKGHNVNLGSKRSNESRKKMSLAQKGHHVSQEQRMLLSAKFKIIAKEKGYGKWMLGKKQSKETIEKRRISMTGRKNTQETIKKMSDVKMGKLNPMYGKKPTREHRLRISETLKKIKASKKDVNFNKLYKLIRDCPYTKMWRESIFERDNFTCVWCGDNRGGNLQADHIKPFILILKQNLIESLDEALQCDEFWDISNGRTLCITCHKTTDTWGNKAKIWL